MSLEREIERYLRSEKVGAMDLARSFQDDHELVLYGETHVGLSKKAEFFGRILRTGQIRYHASEHFDNTVSLGRAVEGYLEDRHGRTGLPPDMRVLVPVLDAIKPATNVRGLVFGGSLERSGVRRHARIFANFISSRRLHLRARRFEPRSKGHFHIGAFHAARMPQQGSTRTTAQRLIREGFDVGVIRLITDVEGTARNTEEGMSFTAGEHALVEPVRGGGGAFDLVPIVRRVGAGTSFAADVTRRGSPFWRVKPEGATSSRAWTEYFDRLLFLA